MVSWESMTIEYSNMKQKEIHLLAILLCLFSSLPLLAYDVKVTIEFKSGVINAIFHSQGRKKNEACKMITFSNGKLTEIYEEEEAIMKIKSRIEKYINACDSMEKFETLTKQLAAVQKELNKYMK